MKGETTTRLRPKGYNAEAFELIRWLAGGLLLLLTVLLLLVLLSVHAYGSRYSRRSVRLTAGFAGTLILHR